MLREYDNTVIATISLLKLLKVKANYSTIDDLLQNHPDYPSLLSISDTLTKLHVNNAAAKIDPNEIEKIPVPFIAYTTYLDNPFVVINKIKEDSIEAYTKIDKAKNFTKVDFLKNWNGIYLLAEANEESGEKDYQQNKLNEFFVRVIPSLLIVLSVILSIIFLYQKIVSTSVINELAISFQFLILLAGAGVATMLLWYEIDRSNPLLHKVCTGIIKGNCNAILSGKASKVFKWLSWSEVGFFYFTGGLITLLFAGKINDTITIIAWLNALALPYIIFSIYYQGVVAKEWCLFCLTVQALLLFGGINLFANHLLTSIFSIPVLTIFKAVLLYLFPVVLWYTLKPQVLKIQTAKQTKRELARIKFNTEIFVTLLNKQKTITTPVDGLGIDIGNSLAKNTIIKVCNPYCGPCAKAHPDIEKLLEQNENVRAKIIFTATAEDNDYRNKPVKHLLAIAQQGNEKLTKQALDDWYLAEEKDYESFAKKYPMNGELEQQNEKIKAMEKWCSSTGIQFTPTIFINGYQLPETYSIGDLNYFLQE